MYSCSAGHDSVDNLVTHSVEMDDAPNEFGGFSAPSSPAPDLHGGEELPSHGAWGVPMSLHSSSPQWVIIDVGPNTFVSGVSLQLSGRDGANPRHCRLVMSSSPLNPLKGWYVLRSRCARRLSEFMRRFYFSSCSCSCSCSSFPLGDIFSIFFLLCVRLTVWCLGW